MEAQPGPPPDTTDQAPRPRRAAAGMVDYALLDAGGAARAPTARRPGQQSGAQAAGELAEDALAAGSPAQSPRAAASGASAAGGDDEPPASARAGRATSAGQGGGMAWRGTLRASGGSSSGGSSNGSAWKQGAWFTTLSLEPRESKKVQALLGAARVSDTPPNRCARCLLECRAGAAGPQQLSPSRHPITGEPLCVRCKEDEAGSGGRGGPHPCPAWCRKEAQRLALAEYKDQLERAERGLRPLQQKRAPPPAEQPRPQQQQQSGEGDSWWRYCEGDMVEQLAELIMEQIPELLLDGKHLRSLLSQVVRRKFAGSKQLYLSMHSIGGGASTDAALVLSDILITSLFELLPVDGRPTPLHATALLEAKRKGSLRLTEFQQNGADGKTVVAWLCGEKMCLLKLDALRGLEATPYYHSGTDCYSYGYGAKAVRELADEASLSGLGPAEAAEKLLPLLVGALSFEHSCESLLRSRLRLATLTPEYERCILALAANDELRGAARLSELLDRGGVDVQLVCRRSGFVLDLQHRKINESNTLSLEELSHDTGYVLWLTYSRGNEIIDALVPGPVIKLVWDAGARNFFMNGEPQLRSTFLPQVGWVLERLGLVFCTPADATGVLAALLQAGGDLAELAAACPAIHDAPFWRCLADTGVPPLLGRTLALHSGAVLEGALELMGHPRAPFDTPFAEHLRKLRRPFDHTVHASDLAAALCRQLLAVLPPAAAAAAAVQPQVPEHLQALPPAAAALCAAAAQPQAPPYLQTLAAEVAAIVEFDTAAAARAAARVAAMQASESEEEEETASMPPASPRRESAAQRAAAGTAPPPVSTPDKEEEQQQHRKRDAECPPSASPAAPPLAQRPRGRPQQPPQEEQQQLPSARSALRRQSGRPQRLHECETG